MKKKLINLFIFSTLSIVALSQTTIDSLRLRVHYAASFIEKRPSKGPRQDEQILDIGKYSSKFYSLWSCKHQEAIDSVLARGGTFGDCLAARDKVKYPLSYSYYIVYKNYPQIGELTYTDEIFKRYIYEEPIEEPQWEIIDQDSIIAGYPCQKAVTTYREHTWEVWFTPEIPISNGPWKLGGLPGLILQAYEANGDFTFRCIEIERGNYQPIVFEKRKCIKCTNEKLRNLYISKYKDYEAFTKALGHGPAYGPDGKRLKYPPREAVLMEY